jgi:hypothetical protein
MIFDREFKNESIKLTYSGAKDRYFDENHWFSNNKNIVLALNEYMNFIGYAFGKNY